MKTKTKISKQIHKKTNRDIVDTIVAAKKHEKWMEVANILSGPRRKKIGINLEEIEKQVKAGEKILIPGKVLSLGEISKKIKISALGFSEKAREKLIKAGCEVSTIAEEIKKNSNAKGVKILK